MYVSDKEPTFTDTSFFKYSYNSPLKCALDMHQEVKLKVPEPIFVFTKLNENLVYSAKYCLVWFNTVEQKFYNYLIPLNEKTLIFLTNFHHFLF